MILSFMLLCYSIFEFVSFIFLISLLFLWYDFDDWLFF